MVAAPRPDGTVQVEQKLVFDAGPGMDYPVTWYIGGTQIGWQSPAREAQYGVIPTISGVTAHEVTTTGGTVDLAVRVDDSGIDDPFFDGYRYRLAAPRPWAPGRHAVMISYTLADVWAQAEGVRILVLPLQFVRGPANPQSADLVRLKVRGASALQCPARRADPGAGEAPMTSVRVRFSAAVVTMVLALLLPSSAQAEPNPYGDSSTATTITLDRDGSYQVTLRESQTVVREYQIGFGGSVHDGFRLPDDGSLLPPYLRATYTLTSATWEDGQAAPTRSPGPTIAGPRPAQARTQPATTPPSCDTA